MLGERRRGEERKEEGYIGCCILLTLFGQEVVWDLVNVLLKVLNLPKISSFYKGESPSPPTSVKGFRETTGKRRGGPSRKQPQFGGGNESY